MPSPDWFDQNPTPPGLVDPTKYGEPVLDPNWVDPNAPQNTLEAARARAGLAGANAAAANAGTLTNLAALSEGSAMTPWTQQFSYTNFDPSTLPSFTPATYSPTTFTSPGAFVAPTAAEAANDPGYQWALAQGQKQLEGSAAARGTLLTGGTLKGITNYGQGAAAKQYGDVYARRFGEHQQGYAEAYQPWAAGEGFNLQANQQANAAGLGAASLNSQNAFNAWTNNYGKALNEYGIARENFYNNQDRPYNKLLALAQVGQGAANTAGGIQVGQQTGEYGTQAANAAAAASIAAANAQGNAVGQVGTGIMDAYFLNQMNKTRPITYS
jgi:hypothetical protein